MKAQSSIEIKTPLAVFLSSSQLHPHDLYESIRMDGFSIPTYYVAQDANHVYIRITCQGASSAAPNIAVEGRIFGFYFDAYYLPLVLPGAVTRPASDAETLQSTGTTDGAGELQVKLNKVNVGEHFEGLDRLQPQLLPEDQMKQALSDAEQSKGFFQPRSTNNTGTAADADKEADEAAKALLQQALRNQGLTTMNDDDGEAAFDVEHPRAGTGKAASSAQGPGLGYGWKGSFKGPLIPTGSADTRNVLEVADPSSTEPSEREAAALAYEEERWDEGVYMENFLDMDGELAHTVRYRPTLAAARHSENNIDDTSLDVEALALILQLLFAFSYDERTNEGDPTVESGWTIAKLSRSLAASTLPQTSSSLDETVLSTLTGCVRRALTVPLYRHWELAMACIDDTISRLTAGNGHVAHCLDQIGQRLGDGQDAILCRLSEVWVAPLKAQLPSQSQLSQLAENIRQVMQQGNVITKDSVGGQEWDLQVLEQAAKQALEDGEGGFV